MNTQDPKPRPLTHSILIGIIAGAIRTILDWIITLITR